MPPTLLQTGTFSFYKLARVTYELKALLKNTTAIQIILAQIRYKLDRANRSNKLYFLKGRTGSGKSTLLISYLYENLLSQSYERIICTEPRVVLCKSNANDIIRYNTTFAFGKNVGILTGIEKIKCKERSCIYYATTQILNDLLIGILSLTDVNEIRKQLKHFKIIVIDEVHILDLPMLQIQKTCKDIIDKFQSFPECPIFIFASATINIEQTAKYFLENDYENSLTDPYLIGEVSGLPNHGVTEYFLTPQEIQSFYEQESKLSFGGCYDIMTNYFYDKYYKTIFESESYIKINDKKYQCRDVLFFVPLILGIKVISNVLQKIITDTPVFSVGKTTENSQLEQWRDKHKNTKRILIIGFARGYSKLSNELVEQTVLTDDELLTYETRIFIATPIIETGKTIPTLYMCIDMGLQTISVYMPLTHDYNNELQALKQLPVNKNQVTQRLGRVGREAPGLYLHFYSKEIMDKFSDYDMPDTQNNACLSNLLLSFYKTQPVFKQYDIFKYNNYLYPISVDIMIRTMRDLMFSGFFTTNVELVSLRTSYTFSDIWIIYAEYLYYIKKYSLYESLIIAAINRKHLPPIYTVRNLDVDTLYYKINSIENNITDELIEGIQLARNTLTLIVYSKYNESSSISQSSLTYNKNRLY